MRGSILLYLLSRVYRSLRPHRPYALPTCVDDVRFTRSIKRVASAIASYGREVYTENATCPTMSWEWRHACVLSAGFSLFTTNDLSDSNLELVANNTLIRNHRSPRIQHRTPQRSPAWSGSITCPAKAGNGPAVYTTGLAINTLVSCKITHLIVSFVPYYGFSFLTPYRAIRLSAVWIGYKTNPRKSNCRILDYLTSTRL